MNPTITFRGMQSSPPIEQYVQERIKKIEHILSKEPSPKNLEVILEANTTHHHHIVELRLHSAHYHLRAQAEGADLYERIDHVFGVLLNEIRKHKDKWISERKEAGRPEEQ